MKSFIVASLFLSSCLAVPFSPSTFGQLVNYPQSRIVGGTNAVENQFPHQISLRKNGNHNCGGSILNENWIVTAAHCVVDYLNRPEDPKIFLVEAGTIVLQKGTTYEVSKVIVHEKYANFQNDIALLKLSTPLSFSKAAQPIELATEEVPQGGEIIISGWGRTYTGGPLPDILQFNKANTISSTNCAYYSGINYAGLMCFTSPSANGACNGDSGGPALYNGKLVGIANFVISSCGTSNPDYYAKVSYFTNWISDKIQNN